MLKVRMGGAGVAISADLSPSEGINVADRQGSNGPLERADEEVEIEFPVDKATEVGPIDPGYG